MFDISFGELLLVVVLGVIFIGPKELPVVIRAVARGVIHIKKFMHEVNQMMRELAREAGVDDIKREMEEEFSRDIKMIQGDDGTWYEAYDMDDFLTSNTTIIQDKPNTEKQQEAGEKPLDTP